VSAEPSVRLAANGATTRPASDGAPQPAEVSRQVSSVADPGRLIRQAELFERMAVSEATGYRLRSAGKIGPRALKVGGGIRYHLPEVLAWLQHRRPDGSLHDARTWPPVWEAKNANGRPR
jgi:predicted DNA-binding transcriptional regulator AlpA